MSGGAEGQSRDGRHSSLGSPFLMCCATGAPPMAVVCDLPAEPPGPVFVTFSPAPQERRPRFAPTPKGCTAAPRGEQGHQGPPVGGHTALWVPRAVTSLLVWVKTARVDSLRVLPAGAQISPCRTKVTSSRARSLRRLWTPFLCIFWHLGEPHSSARPLLQVPSPLRAAPQPP